MSGFFEFRSTARLGEKNQGVSHVHVWIGDRARRSSSSAVGGHRLSQKRYRPFPRQLGGIVAVRV